MPSARRLARHRVGREPARLCRVSPRDRADYRRSPSLTCARLSRRLGSCVLTVASVVVSAPPRAWSLARQCQVHRASRVIALAMSNATLRLAAGPSRLCRSPSFACARLSRRLVLISRSRRSMSRAQPRRGRLRISASARRRRHVLAMGNAALLRLAAGAEPTLIGRFSRVRAPVAPTRVWSCVLTVASAVVSRAATDVIACASVPSARRLARHRAGHWPTRLCRVSPRGRADPRRSLSLACARLSRRLGSGSCVLTVRQWLSRAQPRTWSLARQCQVHGASRVIALAMSQRDYVASRRGDRADYRRSLSLACARLSRRLGSLCSHGRAGRCLARRHGRGRLCVSAKCTAPRASSRWP